MAPNETSEPVSPSPEVVSSKKIRAKTVIFSSKIWGEKAFLHLEWRVFQNAACKGLQTYVIAVEKSDRMVFVPSKSKDMNLVYIACI